ncbi:MAG: aminotransferase class I/II-fold pyridoxal phosphate-dependent enzyme [Phycisphaeraceae bacterium]|nr:aminotransferase class I/II-fold pyridoxal phosphate-dependent enzyme [Phycisphaeraceae bacterium]
MPSVPEVLSPAVDLRSDTVTRPTPAMKRAMAEAELGDDVNEGDPTVRRLEARVADLLGKEAACYVPSGTMANLLAIRSQTQAGDEIIADADSHFHYYETGGYAAIAGCTARFVRSTRGVFEAGEVHRLCRAHSDHFAVTRLVVVENTHNRGGGIPWPVEQARDVARAAHSLGLRAHMDGARLWNAAIAMGVRERDYALAFDTISVCFSKGLGAPVGSALAGDRRTIEKARHFRKMVGGSMRQSGVIAAGALYAIEHHRERLHEDHAAARRFAEIIFESNGVRVDMDRVRTNMVYFDIDERLGPASEFSKAMDRRGVRMFDEGPQTIRAVCHLDVTPEQVEQAARLIVDATHLA